MARQRTPLNKQVAVPSGSPEKKRRKRSTPTETGTSTLHAALQAKEDGKKAHLHARKMTSNYSGHVCRACEWLQCSLEGDLTAEGTGSTGTDCPSTEEFYNDPLSKDAFERIPNKRSNEALSLYLAWRGFQEQVSQSTVEGICTALKWHWDRA